MYGTERAKMAQYLLKNCLQARTRMKNQPQCGPGAGLVVEALTTHGTPGVHSVHSRIEHCVRVLFSKGTDLCKSRSKEALIGSPFHVPQMRRTYHSIHVQQWVIYDWLVLIDINGCVSWPPGAHCPFQRAPLDKQGPAGIHQQCRG